MHTEQPRQWTAEEIKDQLMKHINAMVGYWEKNVPEEYSIRQRLNGLAFSILSALDGCNSSLPGFILVPDCHPSDPEYLKSEGSNWYPCQEGKIDHIEGHLGQFMLHEHMIRD